MDLPPADSQIVAGVDALKAVSHPLRVQMLAALRTDGPATSAELARRFGTDTGSTSYHLRQLARFGFIVAADEQHDGRERRWAAAHRTTSWDDAELAQTEQGRAVVSVMRARQVEALQRLVVGYEANAENQPEWQNAAGMSDYIVSLTPASIAHLWERFGELLDERVAIDADDPEAVQVGIFAGGFPVGPE